MRGLDLVRPKRLGNIVAITLHYPNPNSDSSFTPCGINAAKPSVYGKSAGSPDPWGNGLEVFSQLRENGRTEARAKLSTTPLVLISLKFIDSWLSKSLIYMANRRVIARKRAYKCEETGG